MDERNISLRCLNGLVHHNHLCAGGAEQSTVKGCLQLAAVSRLQGRHVSTDAQHTQRMNTLFAHLLVRLVLPAVHQLVQQLDRRLTAILLPILALQVGLCVGRGEQQCSAGCKILPAHSRDGGTTVLCE